MNYVYTSARVAVLWNELLNQDTVEELIAAKDTEECIRILNGCGFSGDEMGEILSSAKEKETRLTRELFADTAEIFVIFYEKIFHNAKAAVKKLYAGGDEAVYLDAPVTGEEIETALREKDYDALPRFLRGAAKDAYEALLRTGDGQAADMILDTGCLTAMAEFAKETKHKVLKRFADEKIAAADVKIALRMLGAEPEKIKGFLRDSSYFSAESLSHAAEDKKELEEFLKKSGLYDIDLKEVDRWSGERLLRVLREHQHDIFSLAPAIAFLIRQERQTALLRLILVCKEQGVDESFLKRKAVRLYE